MHDKGDRFGEGGQKYIIEVDLKGDPHCAYLGPFQCLSSADEALQTCERERPSFKYTIRPLESHKNWTESPFTEKHKSPASKAVKSEDYIMPDGKHKGKNLGEIAKVDVLYLDFLASVRIKDRGLEAAAKDMNQRYAKQIDDAMEI